LLFHWPIKLSWEFVYTASGDNPAVLRGHLAGVHTSLTIVVITKNSLNYLKTGDKQTTCAQVKPDMDVQGHAGSLLNLTPLRGVISISYPLPVHTCHVDRLGEDILLSTACSVVFLYEVRVAGCIAQSCGCEENVYARAEDRFKVFSDKTAGLLGLHKVTLIVPEKTGNEM